MKLVDVAKDLYSSKLFTSIVTDLMLDDEVVSDSEGNGAGESGNTAQAPRWGGKYIARIKRSIFPSSHVGSTRPELGNSLKL